MEEKIVVEQRNREIDPTANVLKLVEEAVKRLNDLSIVNVKSIEDLRKADEKLRDFQFDTIKENSNTAIAHINTIQNLHQRYNEKLEQKETERINAISSAEEVQRTIERERSATAALLLSKTVEQNAEKLRYELSVTKNENNERIGRLEDMMARNAGKSSGVAGAGEWAIRIILFLIATVGFAIAFINP